MTRSLIPWIILVATVIMDFYGFSAVKNLFQESNGRSKFIAYSIYWGMTAYVLFFFILMFSLNLRENSTPVTRFMLGLVMGIFVSKILLTLFLGIQDVGRLISWITNHVFSPTEPYNTSRRGFLQKMSLGIAAMPFFAFIYGMLKTAYDYQIHRVNIPIDNLPEGLNGMKIVQISDIHSGSFGEIEPIRKAVDMINALKPDLFVFTGDLVNNKAKEYPVYLEIFKHIKAPLGQYSILGNHDYGDYVKWESEQAQIENLNTLKSYHKDTHWDLLLNEHRVLEHKGEKFALIGVENWSSKRGFPKYGKLNQAYQGSESIPTKILLSHDPSHWDAEIRKKYSDIQLTLSGHTHGMQFGVETKWIKFSPVQWVYEQWAGLYTKATQHLYVNRGFGFLAYPGRVGIRPEISLLTLVKA